MNKGFDGCVMTLPHVVDEILDRVMPAECRQAKRIINNLRTVTMSLVSICDGLSRETDMVKVMNYQTNHVTYTEVHEAINFVSSMMRSLRHHSMAIGKTATCLLDQMDGYLRIIDEDDRPAEESAYIVSEVSNTIRSKTVHHTID